MVNEGHSPEPGANGTLASSTMRPGYSSTLSGCPYNVSTLQFCQPGHSLNNISAEQSEGENSLHVSAIPGCELISLKEVKGLSLKNERNSLNEAMPHSRPCWIPRISIAFNAAGMFRAPNAPATVSVALVSRLTRSASEKLPSVCRLRSLKTHWPGSLGIDVRAQFRSVERNSAVDREPVLYCKYPFSSYRFLFFLLHGFSLLASTSFP